MKEIGHCGNSRAGGQNTHFRFEYRSTIDHNVPRENPHSDAALRLSSRLGRVKTQIRALCALLTAISRFVSTRCPGFSDIRAFRRSWKARSRTQTQEMWRSGIGSMIERLSSADVYRNAENDFLGWEQRLSTISLRRHRDRTVSDWSDLILRSFRHSKCISRAWPLVNP